MRIVTEHVIAAPIDAVWAALSDFSRYPEWNPFTVGVTGDTAIGSVLALDVVLGGQRMRRKHVLSRFDPPHTLGWTIRTKQPWLMRGERLQTLEDLGDGTVRYTNDEQVHGLVAPLVQLSYGGRVRAGLEAVGPALARFVGA